MKLINLSGRKFGRLTVLSRVENSGNKVRWECSCECGGRSVVSSGGLTIGGTKSCGCLVKEMLPKSVTTHGMSWKIPEYNIWVCMRQRCNNKNNPAYHRYGGRGLKIEKRWDSFENFLADMGRRPSSQHSIERKNNNLGYSKSNCKWASAVEQGSNMRSNKWIEFKGKKQLCHQWDAQMGYNRNTVLQRLHLGWTVERAITQKPRKKSK